MNDGVNLTISKAVFSNLLVSKAGGVIFAKRGSSSTLTELNMESCNVTNSSARLSGGALYVSDLFLVASIKNSRFTNLMSSEQGGAFYFGDVKSVEISNCIVEVSSSKEGKILFSSAGLGTFNLNENEFYCQSESTVDDYYDNYISQTIT